jgi:tRNA dimethylallyltransferase
MQALGYRQIAEHLRGMRPLPETIELVKLRTRQFAKRQMTWFRRQIHLSWIQLGPDRDASAVLEAVRSLQANHPAAPE